MRLHSEWCGATSPAAMALQPARGRTSSTMLPATTKLNSRTHRRTAGDSRLPRRGFCLFAPCFQHPKVKKNVSNQSARAPHSAGAEWRGTCTSISYTCANSFLKRAPLSPQKKKEPPAPSTFKVRSPFHAGTEWPSVCRLNRVSTF